MAATTRVCAYDRAGQGWSEEAASPRDGVQSAEELHTLLAKAGEHGPYVLVGHSTGGTYAMTYAARYPDQVAGMVLLDSSSPEQFTRMPAFSGQYKLMMRPTYSLMPTLSRLGVGQIPSTSHLPAADAAKVTAITSKPAVLPQPARRDLGHPGGLRPGPGAHHARRPAARRGDRVGERHRDQGLGPRPGPARRTVGQLRAPHRGLHPRGPARGHPPRGRLGPRHHRGHHLGPHPHTGTRALTRTHAHALGIRPHDRPRVELETPAISPARTDRLTQHAQPINPHRSANPGSGTRKGAPHVHRHHQHTNTNEVTETFQVIGMTCGHCAGAVTGELTGITGVLDVRVDVPTGQVTVTSTTPLTTADVRNAIDEAGYQLA